MCETSELECSVYKFVRGASTLEKLRWYITENKKSYSKVNQLNIEKVMTQVVKQ